MQTRLQELKEKFSKAIEIPDEFCCIISTELLVDPVVTPQGHIFTKQKIVGWLQRNPTCPMTDAPLSVNDLISHPGITQLVQNVRKDHAALEKAIASCELNDEKKLATKLAIWQQEMGKRKNKLEEYKKEIIARFTFEKIKEGLYEECQIVMRFVCSLSREFPDFDPVVTPYGYCFRASYLIESVRQHPSCPITRQPLQEEDIFYHPQLDSLIKRVNWAFEEIMTSIDNMRADEIKSQREKIKKYHLKIQGYTAQLDGIIWECLEQREVKRVINKLLLNKKDERHLSTWDRLTNHGPFGLGGVEVVMPTTGKVYKIPTKIDKMMDAAEKFYENKKQLLAELDKVRSQKVALGNNPFSFLGRSSTASLVYDAPDLEKIDLTPQMNMG